MTLFIPRMQLIYSNKHSKKMNLPGTRIVKQYSWLRHLRYLLLVPVLIAVGYSSYRYGKQMRSLDTVCYYTRISKLYSFAVHSISFNYATSFYFVARNRDSTIY